MSFDINKPYDPVTNNGIPDVPQVIQTTPKPVPGQNLNTPALWVNNPEGYKQYQRESNLAAQQRAQAQVAVNRVQKLPTSTGGHGITPEQARALQARAQQTRYITSQGIQANRPTTPQIISEPVSEYNKRYGFPSRPSMGEARLYYEVTPTPPVVPEAKVGLTQKGPAYAGQVPWASGYKPPEPNLRGGINIFNSPVAQFIGGIEKHFDIGAKYGTLQKDVSKRLDPYIPAKIEAQASYDFRKGIFGPFLPKETVVEVPIGLDYHGGYSTVELYPQPGRGQSEIMGNVLLAGEMKGWHEKPIDTALLTAATFMLPEVGTIAKNTVKYSPRLAKIAAQEVVFKEGGWWARNTGRASVPGIGKILIGEVETAAPHVAQFVKAPAIRVMGKEVVPAFSEVAPAFKGSGRFINVPITVAELGIGVSWGQSALERITGTQEQRVSGIKTFTTPGSTRTWTEGGITYTETISPKTTTETQYETVNVPAIPASVNWNMDRSKGNLGLQWGIDLNKMPEGKAMGLTTGEIIGTEILPAAFGMVAGDYTWTRINTWAKTRNDLFIPLEPTRGAPTPTNHYEQELIANRQQMREIFVSNPTGKNKPQIGSVAPFELMEKEPSFIGGVVEQIKLPFAKRTIRQNIQTSGRLVENQDLVIPGFERVVGPMGEGVATEFQFVQAKGRNEKLRNAVSLALKKESPQKAKVWEEMWQAIEVANNLDIKPRPIDVATLLTRSPNIGGQGAAVAAGLRGTPEAPTILYGGTSTHLYYDFVKPIKDIDAVASWPGLRANYIVEKTGWKDQFNLVIPTEHARNPKGKAQVDILNQIGREVEVLDIHAPHTYKGVIEYGYKPAPPVVLEEGFSSISYGEQFANTMLRSNVVGVSPQRKLTLTTKPSSVKSNVDALVGVLDLERKTGMDFPALKQEYLNRIARMPEGIKKKEIYPRAKDYGLDIRQIQRDYLGGKRTQPGETKFNMGLDFSEWGASKETKDKIKVQGLAIKLLERNPEKQIKAISDLPELKEGFVRVVHSTRSEQPYSTLGGIATEGLKVGNYETQYLTIDSTVISMGSKEKWKTNAVDYFKGGVINEDVRFSKGSRLFFDIPTEEYAARSRGSNWAGPMDLPKEYLSGIITPTGDALIVNKNIKPFDYGRPLSELTTIRSGIGKKGSGAPIQVPTISSGASTETELWMGPDLRKVKESTIGKIGIGAGAKEAIVPGGLGYAGPGYPTNPKVVLGDNLMKSFERGTLIPPPTKLSGTRAGQSSKINYVPTHAFLPGEPLETKAMWTAWEGGVGPVGYEFNLGSGGSEFTSMSGSPVVEAHFSKWMTSGSSEVRLFGFGFPRAREPEILRTGGKRFEYFPPHVTAAAERGDYGYVNNWMARNAEEGVLYFPRFKKEFEAILPAFNKEGNVKLRVAARDYYTKAGNTKIPIVNLEIVGVTPWSEVLGGQPNKIGYSQKRGGSVGWLSEADVIGRMHTEDRAAAQNLFKVGNLVKGMRTKNEGPINFALVESVGKKNAPKVEATLIKYKATVAGSTARTGQISPGRLREYKGRPADLDLTAKDFHGLANQLAKDMGGRVQKKAFNLQVKVRGKPVADVNPVGRRQSNPFGWTPTDYVTTQQGYKYDRLNTQVQRYTYNEYNTLLGRSRVQKGEFRAEFGRKTKDTQRLFTDVQTLLMESDDARKTREIAAAMREVRKHPEVRKVVGTRKYTYGPGKEDYFSGVPVGESYINKPGQISLINPTVLGTNSMLIPKTRASSVVFGGGEVSVSQVSMRGTSSPVSVSEFSMYRSSKQISERSSVSRGSSSILGGSSSVMGGSSIVGRSSVSGGSSISRTSGGSSISKGGSSIYGGGSSISGSASSKNGGSSSILGRSSGIQGKSSIYGGDSSISGGSSSGNYPPKTPPGTPPHTPPGVPPITPPPTRTKPPIIPMSTLTGFPILEVKRKTQRRRRRGMSVSQWNIKNPVPRIATLSEMPVFTYRKDWAPTNLKVYSKKVIVESFPGEKTFVMKRM